MEISWKHAWDSADKTASRPGSCPDSRLLVFYDNESVAVPVSPSPQRLLLPTDKAVEQKACLLHAATAHSPGS